MILPILLAALFQATSVDTGALIKTAADRLAVPCESPDCDAVPANDRYRISTEDGPAVTSKDRAIRDDGSRCNVVGFKRCTSNGATILTTRQ